MSDYKITPLQSGTDSMLQPSMTSSAQSLRNEKTGGDSLKIKKAAQDFESILLSKWLEQAEQSFGTTPGGGDDDDDEEADVGKTQLNAIAMQSLAAGLTHKGGFGIAKMIERQLNGSSFHKDSDTSPPTGSPGSAPVVPQK